MSQEHRRQALVLASSRGIGYACAHALARDGYSVCLNGRNEDTLMKAQSQLQEQFPGTIVRALRADLGLAHERERLLSDAGVIDALVLNIGGPTPVPTQNCSEQHWRESFEQLFLPLTHMLDSTLPAMMRRGWGRVVLISSIAVRQPLPGLSVSGAYRAALANLMLDRARYAAAYGVVLNSILPGRIVTDRQKNALRRDAERLGVSVSDYQAQVEQTIPMRRLGTPEEVGQVCAFLCSEGAAYMTGQSLLVDGGVAGTLF